MAASLCSVQTILTPITGNKILYKMSNVIHSFGAEWFKENMVLKRFKAGKFSKSVTDHAGRAHSPNFFLCWK